MIVGVGGQGTFLTSRILGKPAIGMGYDVKLSEVHGMAQRGGSVVAFVRYGERVAEPIVEEGQADVLIASERLEALQYLHSLKEDGVIIVNDWHTDPIAVVMGVAKYPGGIIDRLKEARRTIVVEVMEEAEKMGAPKVFNVIVLGAVAKHMRFEKEDQLKAIETMIPSKAVGINKEAFEADYTFSVQMDKGRR